ncbi:DUF1515 family protein [Rhizobium sp. ARZ01]|uniref:DUF1515 family protein n=1 Tax=Rhizobium sp. ARZ01 TaxID=2769313 RepID=UPI00177C95FB|nr:DUF1515 family protein [Rhizobium sp. ARZ01]MBD9375644.1 DUF1515 family protein [Rhizobium sp. ARZ01]
MDELVSRVGHLEAGVSELKDDVAEMKPVTDDVKRLKLMGIGALGVKRQSGKRQRARRRARRARRQLRLQVAEAGPPRALLRTRVNSSRLVTHIALGPYSWLRNRHLHRVRRACMPANNSAGSWVPARNICVNLSGKFVGHSRMIGDALTFAHFLNW